MAIQLYGNPASLYYDSPMAILPLSAIWRFSPMAILPLSAMAIQLYGDPASLCYELSTSTVQRL